MTTVSYSTNSLVSGSLNECTILLQSILQSCDEEQTKRKDNLNQIRSDCPLSIKPLNTHGNHVNYSKSLHHYDIQTHGHSGNRKRVLHRAPLYLLGLKSS